MRKLLALSMLFCVLNSNSLIAGNLGLGMVFGLDSHFSKDRGSTALISYQMEKVRFEIEMGAWIRNAVDPNDEDARPTTDVSIIGAGATIINPKEGNDDLVFLKGFKIGSISYSDAIQNNYSYSGTWASLFLGAEYILSEAFYLGGELSLFGEKIINAGNSSDELTDFEVRSRLTLRWYYD